MPRKSKYTDKQKIEFHKRRLKVIKSLPINWLNILLQSSPTLPINRAMNVHKGTTIDFELLERMEAI